VGRELEALYIKQCQDQKVKGQGHVTL